MHKIGIDLDIDVDTQSDLFQSLYFICHRATQPDPSSILLFYIRTVTSMSKQLGSANNLERTHGNRRLLRLSYLLNRKVRETVGYCDLVTNRVT